MFRLAKRPWQSNFSFLSIWQQTYLVEMELLVTGRRFWILHARLISRCFRRLAKCGTFIYTSLDAASVICSLSVVVGACGMFPRSYESHSSGFDVLYELSRQRTSSRRSSIAHCRHWARFDGTRAVLSCYHTVCHLVSVLWLLDGCKELLGTCPAFYGDRCRVDNYCFALLVFGCAFDYVRAYWACWRLAYV